MLPVLICKRANECSHCLIENQAYMDSTDRKIQQQCSVAVCMHWLDASLNANVCLCTCELKERARFSKFMHTWISLYEIYLWFCTRSSGFRSMLILPSDPRTLFIMMDKQLTGSSGFCYCRGWYGFNRTPQTHCCHLTTRKSSGAVINQIR